MVINNLGRRRYPLHWWAHGRTFVRDPQLLEDEALRQAEEAESRAESQEEGEYAVESNESGSEINNGEESVTQQSGSREMANSN